MKKAKKLLIIILVAFYGLNMDAQKIITKNIEYENQTISVDFKFANIIDVKTWDKSSICVKINIKTKDDNYVDLYEIDIDKSENEIKVVSNAEPIFIKLREDYIKQHPNKKTSYYGSDKDYEFNYELFIPTGANLEISSYTGSVKSEQITGNLTVNLGNGNIEILDYNGSLNLNTISGEIDLIVANVSLVAETSYGDIYADQNLELRTINTTQGKKVEGNLRNTINRVVLNSIKGNIYLRL